MAAPASLILPDGTERELQPDFTLGRARRFAAGRGRASPSGQALKAALRRSYAKAGLTAGSPYAKRRALCKIARQRDRPLLQGPRP